jgi:hypothetical protein
MHPKRFAFIAGIIMLALGLVALIPSLVGSFVNLPALKVEASYGLFLGYFPMNIFNKVALILFGIAGIWVSRERFNNLPASITYSRVLFIAMGILAILGAIPQTSTLMGYWPLFGKEIGAHAVIAILGAYFGYALTAKVPSSGPRQTDFKTPLTNR